MTFDWAREQATKDASGSFWQSLLPLAEFGLDLLPGPLKAIAEGATKFLQSIGKAKAEGDQDWEGGKVLVGENGPEVVDLPKGSNIHPSVQTLRDRRVRGGQVDGYGMLNHITAGLRDAVRKPAPVAPPAPKQKVTPERISKAWSYIGGLK